MNRVLVVVVQQSVTSGLSPSNQTSPHTYLSLDGEALLCNDLLP